MPSVAVKLYSLFFKLLLKHKLQHRSQMEDAESPFGVTSRPEESTAPVNPSFGPDGVATKDIHIDPLTALSIRIFLPDPSLHRGGARPRWSPDLDRRNSYGGSPATPSHDHGRRSSYDGAGSAHENGNRADAAAAAAGNYRGYLPSVVDARRRTDRSKKLPIIIQFHGGGFVAGSNTSAANDFFCRRMAKLCDAMVIAVGYRLAPESRYPAAFDDGLKVLNWLGKQAKLVECKISMGTARGGGIGEVRRSQIVDTFGASTVEPWLAAHGDPSRCVLLGVSCGANIADYVARKAVDAGKLIEPVKVVAQVLMYPFFVGSVPTHSEIKLANSYFYDKSLCLLAWKLFLPEGEFSLDHPAANPLVPGRGPPLKCMPPTLTVVAEHDWMRDRAIAYSEELRKVNVDAPVLEYKDAVHEFATLDMLLKTPQAQACAEDIAIWVKKYISIRGHEFSY
ncbi:hypothetical protein C4D60_Mb07t04480 [Musa balbisiana]|uniref:Alpha/beta hydrolase fold-3 domain-containing protein n=1 Tax=Musa balbisiana TaxID=52838 RepID=A0A4S8JCZ1_MUSBA|nr:hypothetical protein C4D60_Mb07t04480 [Musa balbisiana]